MPCRRSRISACPASLPKPASGWPVVAGAFLTLLTGWGTVYAYAALAPGMARAAGVSEEAAGLVYAIAAGSAFLVGALAGPLADRCGPRLPALLGVLLLGLGPVFASKAESLTSLALSFGLLVGAGAGLVYTPAMAAVRCRFTTRRGLACGIAASGIGAGTMLVPLAAVALEPFGEARLLYLAALVVGGFCCILCGGVGLGRSSGMATRQLQELRADLTFKGRQFTAEVILCAWQRRGPCRRWSACSGAPPPAPPRAARRPRPSIRRPTAVAAPSDRPPHTRRGYGRLSGKRTPAGQHRNVRQPWRGDGKADTVQSGRQGGQRRRWQRSATPE